MAHFEYSPLALPLRDVIPKIWGCSSHKPLSNIWSLSQTRRGATTLCCTCPPLHLRSLIQTHCHNPTQILFILWMKTFTDIGMCSCFSPGQKQFFLFEPEPHVACIVGRLSFQHTTVVKADLAATWTWHVCFTTSLNCAQSCYLCCLPKLSLFVVFCPTCNDFQTAS